MTDALFLVLFLAGWCALLCLAGLLCHVCGLLVQALNNAVDVDPPLTYTPASLRDHSEFDQ
ncbi:MAG: hypothetical protein EHM62_05785 [Methylococcus sp.]|nr:MAG: hypothetical protein EHM62_05785 [Methylococcus sp.]